MMQPNPILSVVLCLVPAGSLAAQAVSFQSREIVDPEASWPGLVIDDFNRDGKPDLVLGTGDGSIKVLLGNGDGTFQPPRTFPAGAIRFIVVGDFNNDGNPDLALTNRLDGVVVLLGNGDGTFQPPLTFPAGVQPDSIAVSDFNGDGRQDLVVTNSGSDFITVLLGNGDGTFQLPRVVVVGALPTAIVVSDFNGDGRQDLAVTNSNVVSVLLGNGDGDFQPPRTFPVGGQPRSIVVSDFNRDGLQDLAVANFGTNVISVLLGNGDGTFQSPISSSVGQVGSVAVGDFNRDGLQDLAVLANDSDTVLLLLGNGDGTFQPPVEQVVSFNSQTVAASDLNLDGNLDLVAGTSVLLGQGDGTFRVDVRTTLPYPWVPYALDLGDFNNDGNLDAVVLASGLGSAIFLLVGNGDGTFAPLQVPSLPSAASAEHIVVDDFNGDGNSDFAVTYSNATVMLMLGNGDGTFVALELNPLISPAAAIEVSDLNGDGYPDIVTAHPSTGKVGVMLGNGDGTFQPAQYFDAGQSSTSVGIGDLNGDGNLDLVGVDSDYDPVDGSNTYYATALLGKGDGTFQPPQRIGAIYRERRPSVVDLVVHDFNNDGRDDVAAVLIPSISDYTLGVIVLLSHGDGTFRWSEYPLMDQPPTLTLANLTADGNSAIVIPATLEKVPGRDLNAVLVLQANSDGTFQQPVYFGTGRMPRVVAAGDVNGDGKIDLVTVNAGDISVLLNTTPP